MFKITPKKMIELLEDAGYEAIPYETGGRTKRVAVMTDTIEEALGVIVTLLEKAGCQDSTLHLSGISIYDLGDVLRKSRLSSYVGYSVIYWPMEWPSAPKIGHGGE